MARSWVGGVTKPLFALCLLGLAMAPSAAKMAGADTPGSDGNGRITIALVDTVSPMTLPDAAIFGQQEQPRKNADFKVQMIENRPSTDTSERQKEIYLTFDDGPVNGTRNVLRVLEEEGVEATMFFVGRHVRKRPNLYNLSRRMHNLLIANHTYSHANGHYQRFYSNAFNVMSDIEHAQLVIGGRKYLRLAGRNVWRTPDIKRNDAALSAHRRSVEYGKYELIEREGFFIYGWDVEWRFDHVTGKPLSSAESLVQKVERVYRNGRPAKQGKIVLLAHDFMFKDERSSAQLRRFIQIMRQRGWSFRKVDHYSAAQPEPLRVAKYYGKQEHIAMNEPHSVPNELRTTPGRSAAKGVDSVSKKRALTMLESSIAKEKVTPMQKSDLQTSLNEAIRSYRAKEVERILARGAKINGKDRFGRTALNTAVRANSLVLVKKLLAYGASLHMKDGQGRTALQTAREYRRQEIERVLIEYSLQQGAQYLAAAEPRRQHRRDPLQALR